MRVVSDLNDLTQALATTLAEIEALEAPGTDLVALSGASADEVKAQMTSRHAALAERVVEARRLREELERATRAHMAELEARLAPLEAQMKRLREGIWAVSLYTGRDETLVTLAEGEPAPASAPLVVRQAVLSMDEETALFAERGGIDFQDLAEVDAWLTDPAHLAQVAPWEKCVVVFRARRTDKEYGDPMTDRFANDENKRSYWLLRNGERLWRMTTDLEVGDRLVPRRDEFTRLFESRLLGATTPLVPGTAAWLRAEEAQDARQRHFMRCALVLQGLLDRTPIFAPFEGSTPSVLHPEDYDNGRVVLWSDDEANQLGAGRPPFYQWLADLNHRLRPGMRILGAFDTTEFHMVNSGREYSTPRVSPRHASNPPSGVVLRLERWGDREGGTRPLVFLYERTDTIWARGEDGWGEARAARTRASCRVYPYDRFILPFDLVSVAEMRAYLSATSERHAYRELFPLLRAAIEAKEAEAAEEAPMRALLAGEIARRFGVTIDEDLHRTVDELVTEWKLANRWHRALVSSSVAPGGADAATEARAVEAICAAYAQRRGSGDEEAVVERLRAHDPTIMFVGRARTGRYVAYAPTARRYGADAAPAVYATEYRIDGTTGTGRITSREWVLPRRLGGLRTLWSDERWASFDTVVEASECATDEELATLARTMRGAVDVGDATFYAVTHDAANQTVELWALAPGWETVPPARPDYHGDIVYRLWRATWTRRAGRAPVLGAARPMHYGRGESWRIREEADLWRPVWDGRSRQRDPIVVDETVAQRVAAVRAARREASARSDAWRDVIRRAHNAVDEAWVARELEAAKARVVADDGTDALWESQRKGIARDLRNKSRARYEDWNLEPVLVALVVAGDALEGTVGSWFERAAGLVPAESLARCPDDLYDLDPGLGARADA